MQQVYRIVSLVTVFLLACLGPASALAVELGPRAAPEDTFEGMEETEESVAGVPPLRLAIPVLDPRIPETEKERYDRGIWPALRKAEAVRIAIKLQQAINARGTFADVVVSPDAATSADFYLLGRIEQSNAEDLEIRYALLDATQRTWIPGRCGKSGKCWQRAKHRLWEGWHEAHDAMATDPFHTVYDDIAARVDAKLDELRAKHDRQVSKNEDLVAKGRSPRLSDLETAAAMRSIVFAAYFAPDVYGDAVEERRGRLRLAYLPALDGGDWSRIEAIRARDERFGNLLTERYGELAVGMQTAYAGWQKDVFPLARAARLARREATWSTVAGVIAGVGAAAAATDGDNTEAAVGLAGTSAVAIMNSIHESRKAKALLAEFNEIGASVQGALKPLVVETAEKAVTLTGTAQEQFTQWRGLLAEIYTNTAVDIDAVQFVDAG